MAIQHPLSGTSNAKKYDTLVGEFEQDSEDPLNALAGFANAALQAVHCTERKDQFDGKQRQSGAAHH